MAENELNPNSDENNGANQERIQRAFGSLHESISQRVNKQDEERVLGIREAVTLGNREQAQEHLTAVKQESSWLYEELMKHPEISAIMRELSIMGL